MKIKAAVGLLLLLFLIACAGESCPSEGATEVTNDHKEYVCTDRGSGLRWYQR